MLVDPDEHPSFYKFLFKEGFVDKLLMPHAFIKENKNMLGKTCLLRTNEKVFWKAKIVREKSNYFICEAEWAQFVVYHKLELGDVLLFVLIDKSTFQVLPYQRKLDKTLSGEELSSSSEEEAEERPNEDEREEEQEVDPEEEEAQEAEDVGEEKDKGEKAKEDEGEEEEIRPSRKSKKHKLQGVEASDNFEGEDIVSSEKSKKYKTQIIPWKKVIGPSSGSEDGDSPCYSHSGGKSYTEAKSIVLVKKEAPELKRRSKLKDPEEEGAQEAEDVGEEKEDVKGEDEDKGERAKEDEGEEEEIRPSRKSKKHKLQQGVEASDNFEGEDIVSSEKSKKCKTQIIPWEKVIGLSSGSEDGDSPCYSHSGSKSYTEAKSIFLVKKKASGLKRRSKLKDPNKPKHPVPPFLVFMEEFRKDFKKKNPGCRNALVGSAAGNKWRQFSEAEKAPYVAETEKRKAEYRKNMMAYWKKQMVCASSKGEESNKSSSEVDDEKEGS